MPLLAAAIVGWGVYSFVSVRYLVITVQLGAEQPFLIHYDWHAYVAGALDLIDRTLYRQPLELGGVPLPLTAFNMPPMAALEAAVFLPLGRSAGGVAWQVLGVSAVALAAISLPRLWGKSWRRSVQVAGVILGVYLLLDHVLIPDPLSYWWGLVLGTNNYLMLGLIAAFAISYRAGRDRLAGSLLALAVATKIWPLTLAVLVLRERRWRVAVWAAALSGLQAFVWLAWLGPDVVPHAIEALLQEDQAPEAIIGVAALRSIDWWPSWAGWLVAALLLALPIRGRAGIGLAILAGLAVITNLWGHYLPTVLFAVGVLLFGNRMLRLFPRRGSVAG